MTKTEIPLLKEELTKRFGAISYQLVLANLDVVGLRIIKSYEIILIAFRGGNKVGYFYEGETLPEEKIFQIFQDVPKSFNDLEHYEKTYEGKIEFLHMPRNNYYIVDESTVKPLKTKP